MSTPMRNRSNNSSISKNNNSNANANTNGSNMYRSGYNPSSLEAGRDTNSNILEQQNNDRISELSDQVARLKGLTIDIGNEVREQNSLLDDMGDGFSGVSNLLGSSLKRIGAMLESGGSKHMCYLVTFVVLVMVFLYWVSCCFAPRCTRFWQALHFQLATRYLHDMPVCHFHSLSQNSPYSPLLIDRVIISDHVLQRTKWRPLTLILTTVGIRPILPTEY